MTFNFEQPPTKLTWYYLSSLLDAEAGTLKYDQERYRVSGVSNNAVACVWCGLLADDGDGLALTDLGRTMLADWKISPAGKAYLTEWPEELPEQHSDQAADTAPLVSARPQQLGLFGGAA